MESVIKKRKTRSREVIITAAISLFLKQGFLATSMDEVAAKANVSKQTVYAHFKSKEALFFDVIDEMTGSAGVNIGSETFADLAVSEYLLNFATRQLDIVMTPELMQLRRLVMGEASRFPELGRKIYDGGPGRSIAKLALALEHYATRGELSIRNAITAASFFNWIVMGGPTNAAMMLGDNAIPPKKELRQHAIESVRIFLSAYGKKSG